MPDSGASPIHSHDPRARAALRNTDFLTASGTAYDLLSTQPYLGWRDPMALPMYGRSNRLARRWWLEAAGRLGLPEPAITRALDRLLKRSEPWLARLPEIGFDETTTERLAALISARRAELAA